MNKSKVVSIVCGAMFGEEGVNYSVALLSRVWWFLQLDKFQYLLPLQFYKSMSIHKNRLYSRLPHQQTAQSCSPLGLLVT